MLSDQVRNIAPKTINAIVASKGKDACGLPEELAEYIWQLSRAYEIFTGSESDGSMLSAARTLQKEFPTISISTARRRVSDSITLMHSGAENTPEEWYEFYADKMDRLGKLCEQNGELEAARRCYDQALEYRVKASAGRVDPERIKYRRLLVSPDVQADRLGLGGAGLRELIRKSRELIEQSGLSAKDKERVMQDLVLEAGHVEEVEYQDA